MSLKGHVSADVDLKWIICVLTSTMLHHFHVSTGNDAIVQVWWASTIHKQNKQQAPAYTQTHSCTAAVMHESQTYPSDIPAAACLLKPVVFPACENSGWPRNPTSVPPPLLVPHCSRAELSCDACVLGGTLSGLRRGLASLVKIHSRLPTE